MRPIGPPGLPGPDPRGPPPGHPHGPRPEWERPGGPGISKYLFYSINLMLSQQSVGFLGC